jgi:hypothetical protein
MAVRGLVLNRILATEKNHKSAEWLISPFFLSTVI